MDINPKDLFSALSHDTRLRCLILLLRHEELCVCEFTHATNLSQPHISRSLAQLRELGIVIDRREGIWIHYSINPSIPEWVQKVFDEVFAGIKNHDLFADDERALNVMPNRPGAARCA